jgi:uncharacterized protein YjbI with pentapeptide repeats
MPTNPSTRQTIPTGLIVIGALLVFFFLLVTVPLLAIPTGVDAPWTGFGEVLTKETKTTKGPPNKPTETTVTQEFLQPKTFWDWMSLVFIPLAGGLTIAVVGYLFNLKQREREEAVQSLRAQDEALQRYLDQMSDLLVNQNLRPEPADAESNGARNYLDRVRNLLAELNLLSAPEDTNPKLYVRDLAQARTVAVLLGLDSEHKRRPLKLVHELGLITKGDQPLELKNVGLDGANLRELTLHTAYLQCADLRVANLKGADLEGTDLTLADLRGSDLSRADLRGVDLTEANLLPYDERNPERWSLHNLKGISLSGEKLRLRDSRSGKHRFRRLTWRGLRPVMTRLTITNLRSAILTNGQLCRTRLCGADLTEADLSKASLQDAQLQQANLEKANLRGANFSGADLTGAIGITNERLYRQAYSVRGATMPNGQKCEDWLQDSYHQPTFAS